MLTDEQIEARAAERCQYELSAAGYEAGAHWARNILQAEIDSLKSISKQSIPNYETSGDLAFKDSLLQDAVLSLRFMNMEAKIDSVNRLIRIIESHLNEK